MPEEMRIPLEITWAKGGDSIPDPGAFTVSCDFYYNRATVQRPKGLALLWVRVQGWWLDHRWAIETWVAKRIGYVDPETYFDD